MITGLFQLASRCHRGDLQNWHQIKHLWSQTPGRTLSSGFARLYWLGKKTIPSLEESFYSIRGISTPCIAVSNAYTKKLKHARRWVRVSLLKIHGLHAPGRHGGLTCNANQALRGMSTPSKLWATQYSLARQRRHASSPRLVVESGCGTRIFRWNCRNAGTRETYYGARQHEVVPPSLSKLFSIRWRWPTFSR